MYYVYVHVFMYVNRYLCMHVWRKVAIGLLLEHKVP